MMIDDEILVSNVVIVLNAYNLLQKANDDELSSAISQLAINMMLENIEDVRDSIDAKIISYLLLTPNISDQVVNAVKFLLDKYPDLFSELYAMKNSIPNDKLKIIFEFDDDVDLVFPTIDQIYDESIIHNAREDAKHSIAETKNKYDDNRKKGVEIIDPIDVREDEKQRITEAIDKYDGNWKKALEKIDPKDARVLAKELRRRKRR